MSAIIQRALSNHWHFFIQTLVFCTLETYIVLLTNITPNKFNLKKKNTGIFIETHTGIFSHGLHAPSAPTTLSSSTQDTEGSDKVEAGEALTLSSSAGLSSRVRLPSFTLVPAVEITAIIL